MKYHVLYWMKYSIQYNSVLSIYNFGPWRPSCGFKFALWSKLGKGQNEVVAASSVSIPFQIEREFFWHGSLLICQLLDINGIGESIFPLSHSAVRCPRNLKSNYNFPFIQLCANNFFSLLKFVFSKKATKIDEIFTINLTLTT